MTPVSREALALYDACQHIADLRLPYVWDGGHEPKAGPTHGEHPDGPQGLDCSGAIRWALVLAGWVPDGHPMNTLALQHWGVEGWGQYATVCAINTPAREHAFLRFTIPGRPGHFWEAAHEGTIVGFVPYMNTDGYHRRRRP